MGLIARALEAAGVATTLTSWHAGHLRSANPPRATMTKLARGATLGQAGNAPQQRRVLAATLGLLAQPAPLPFVELDECA